MLWTKPEGGRERESERETAWSWEQIMESVRVQPGAGSGHMEVEEGGEGENIRRTSEGPQESPAESHWTSTHVLVATVQRFFRLPGL